MDDHAGALGAAALVVERGEQRPRGSVVNADLVATCPRPLRLMSVPLVATSLEIELLRSKLGEPPTPHLKWEALCTPAGQSEGLPRPGCWCT